MRIPLTIDVVSDVVCPWCYIGKRRLERAIKQRPNVKCEIRWLPYFLDPNVPPKGMTRVEYISRKFGIREKMTPGHERIVPLGQDLGIDFRFHWIDRQPNTLDAHRVIKWAQDVGRAKAVVDRLFAMFFSEGADLSDRETIVKAGFAAGMDQEQLRLDLASNRDKDLIKRQASAAVSAGITGVPFFVFGKKVSVAGAQEVELLISAIDQATTKERENLPDDAA